MTTLQDNQFELEKKLLQAGSTLAKEFKLNKSTRLPKYLVGNWHSKDGNTYIHIRKGRTMLMFKTSHTLSKRDIYETEWIFMPDENDEYYLDTEKTYLNGKENNIRVDNKKLQNKADMIYESILYALFPPPDLDDNPTEEKGETQR